MREHKYRYWDEANKIMVYFTLGELLAAYNDEGDYPAIAETDLFRIHQDIDTRQAMDFIGFEDAHGKEIYEGDILKIQDATAKVVFWEKPPEFGLNYYHNEAAWCEDWNLSDDSDRMEIIGNIYEHPHLLEVKA